MGEAEAALDTARMNEWIQEQDQVLCGAITGKDLWGIGWRIDHSIFRAPREPILEQQRRLGVYFQSVGLPSLKRNHGQVLLVVSTSI